MSVQTTSRAWFPGTYVPVSRIEALEILPTRNRVEAAVSKSTVFHGTPGQMLSAAVALLRAAVEADPAAAAKVAPVLAKLTR
jgi:hypothetical protein